MTTTIHASDTEAKAGGDLLVALPDGTAKGDTIHIDHGDYLAVVTVTSKIFTAKFGKLEGRLIAYAKPVQGPEGAVWPHDLHIPAADAEQVEVNGRTYHRAGERLISSDGELTTWMWARAS